MSESNIEIAISSATKLRAKALIFDLLSKACIEDEDIANIEYKTNESNRVSTCLVSFKKLQDAQSFYENCQEDRTNSILSINLNSFNNSNNNNIDDDDDDSIDPNDSISIVGSNHGYQTKNVNLIKTNKKVLIIQNIDLAEFKNDPTVISVYAENLVPHNPVENIETSKLFDRTFYIQFQNDFDFNNAYIRHKRRPSIGHINIEIFEAFNTNSIVGCLENHKEYYIDIFEWHFSNKNKSGVDKYLKIQDCKPFVIVQFPDQTHVNTVLKNKSKHVFKNGAFISEILYNSKLVPNCEQNIRINEE